MNIIQKQSPNFAVGRKGYKPEMIVIHIMDGTLVGTDGWFADTKSQVSSHYGIGLKGEIHQYVHDDDTAWANGQVVPPVFAGLKQGINPNLYTLSIEHEGHDLSKAPDLQLSTSAELIRSLCLQYGIPIDRQHIIGHYQIKSSKPNCPSTDKSVIDKLVILAQPEELVSIKVPKSKVERVLTYLKTIK